MKAILYGVPMRRSVVLAVLVAFAAITVARTALKWDGGLRSEYVTNPATGQTGRTGVDRDASTAAITRAWNSTAAGNVSRAMDGVSCRHAAGPLHLRD
jgi:hypothetical protein